MVFSDTLAITSRAKADKVLMCFDTLEYPKLLYAILDKDYYVLIKDKESYKEYYIAIDSTGKVIELRSLKRTKRENKKLYQLKPFELQNYKTVLITMMPDATYVRGNLSYFVVKDENEKRFGEFCLSTFTLPMPIEGKLYGYLARRLSEQIEIRQQCPNKLWIRHTPTHEYGASYFFEHF